MSSREDWAVAYHRQGRSDWNLYLELQGRDDVPPCHSLHFLQMATEKLAKAYRFRDTSTDIAALLTSHVGFPRFLNAFLMSPQLREEYEGRHSQLERLRKDFAPLARAIEPLAPAVDRDVVPENSEYPWERGDDVIAPVDHRFSALELLRHPRGRMLLKFIRRAFDEFSNS